MGVFYHERVPNALSIKGYSEIVEGVLSFCLDLPMRVRLGD